MATAGSIVVDLLARTGAFDTDIDRSTKATQKRMKEMQKTIDDAGKAFGVAMGGGAAAAVFFTKRWIDQLDALNDAADATGASIENLSALEDIAVRTGTSMDSATGALVKFNQGLKGTDDDGKAAKVLEAIGLNIERLRAMDPAQALMETAKALANFADDGDKARAVQELFGKSVREMAPLLKDMAEKGELVGTVTEEQAKQAEAFNKELFAMQKNVTDLGRSFASDLVTGINNAANAFRQNGSVWDAIKMLFGGTDQFKADKKFADLTDQLLRAQNELGHAQSLASTLPFGLGADRLQAAVAEVKRLEAEIAPLLAARQAPPGMSLDALRQGEHSYKPGLGAVDTAKKPKGPDPDADFKSYLNNLQQQLQKVDQLTVSEKLLDDIRRGTLTVTPAQEKQLATLAATVDKEKEAVEIRKLSRQAVMDEGDALAKANDAYQERLKALTDAGPAAQLEKQREDMLLLADAFQRGAITADQFNDAATGALHLVAEPAEHFKLQLSDTQNLLLDMGQSGARAFEDLALHGGNFGDVMKRLLLDIADMIFQLTVMKPLMDSLRSGITGGVTPPNPDAGFSWGSLFSSMASYAVGTDYVPNDMIAKIHKGERIVPAAENRFIPRTAGAVLPQSAMGGSGGNVTIINPPGTPQVGRATEERRPNGDRVITQHLLTQINDPNSEVSRAMQDRFNLRPRR